MIDPSSVADLGLGVEISICAQRGCLCGRGEISMRSFIGPGEEDGRGGVVTLSINYINTFSVSFYSAMLTTPINCPEKIRREE
jgi:hypothetical protein